MVSIKARVRNPKEQKNSAKYPVRGLCPNANINTMAQATNGIFRKREAIPRLATLNSPLILVVLDPAKDKNKANTAATVVAAIDMSTVSCNFGNISCKILTALASG